MALQVELLEGDRYRTYRYPLAQGRSGPEPEAVREIVGLVRQVRRSSTMRPDGGSAAPAEPPEARRDR